MAGIGSAPSSGRRSLDAELNLVPFIDLLSMCICFLLMTAVWMEVGSVNVKQLVGTEASADPKDRYEMDLKYVGSQQMEVSLKHAGAKTQKYTVQGATNEIGLRNLRDIMRGIAPKLGVKQAADAKTQLGQAISVARVTTKAGISYGEIISVMDVLRDLGIVSLGLVPVRE